MAYEHVKTPSERAHESQPIGWWQARMQDQVATAQAHCTRYIAQEPVKSTLIAIASGALLTGLVMAQLRGLRRGRG